MVIFLFWLKFFLSLALAGSGMEGGCIPLFHKANDGFEKVLLGNLSRFETGAIAGALKLSPRGPNGKSFWNRLGYESGRESDSVLVAPISYINEQIIEMRRQGDPEAPALMMYECEGKEGVLQMAEQMVQGRFPVSKPGFKEGPKGDELRYHDLFLHGVGYLILPKEVVETNKRVLRTLLEIRGLMVNREGKAVIYAPANLEQLDRLISSQIEELDLASGEMVLKLFDTKGDPKRNSESIISSLSLQLSRIYQLEVTQLLTNYRVLERLSQAERAQIESVIGKSQSVTKYTPQNIGERNRALAEELYYRFYPKSK